MNEKVRKGDTRRARGNRTGFTTGVCSAAAARAATCGLLSGEVPSSVVCRLPNGRKRASRCSTAASRAPASNVLRTR
jgi:cobalamin biosynthesis protein CbiD